MCLVLSKKSLMFFTQWLTTGEITNPPPPPFPHFNLSTLGACISTPVPRGRGRGRRSRRAGVPGRKQTKQQQACVGVAVDADSYDWCWLATEGSVRRDGGAEEKCRIGWKKTQDCSSIEGQEEDKGIRVQIVLACVWSVLFGLYP